MGSVDMLFQKILKFKTLRHDFQLSGTYFSNILYSDIDIRIVSKVNILSLITLLKEAGEKLSDS